MEYLICGFMTALALLVVLWRMDIKKFMGYPVTLDVVAVLLFSMLLHGTYVGMASALLAGLIFSGAITVIRRTIGYKKLTPKGWVTYPPTTTIPTELVKCVKLKSPVSWVAYTCLALTLLYVL